MLENVVQLGVVFNNNTIIFKTTDQMMLDIGGFETLIATPTYGIYFFTEI